MSGQHLHAGLFPLVEMGDVSVIRDTPVPRRAGLRHCRARAADRHARSPAQFQAHHHLDESRVQLSGRRRVVFSRLRGRQDLEGRLAGHLAQRARIPFGDRAGHSAPKILALRGRPLIHCRCQIVRLVMRVRCRESRPALGVVRFRCRPVLSLLCEYDLMAFALARCVSARAAVAARRIRCSPEPRLLVQSLLVLAIPAARAERV